MSLQEVDRAAQVIYNNVHEDANVIFGALIDDSLEDSISITVLATGFADTTRQNLEFLNDVVSGNMMSKDAVRSARETVSSSKVYEEEEEYDEEEEDEGEDEEDEEELQ